MSKEKEEYRMAAANEAPGRSGSTFKSSSKRRIYIIVGVVCLLIVVIVAVALVVYFGVRGCDMDKITLTVRSSDCNTPVADVTITSSAELTITEKGDGDYGGEVCGMPYSVSLKKEGFEPLTTTISSTAETVTLTCLEPNCTIQTVNITVTSACGTSPVEGVAIRGQNINDVTSSEPGLYQMKVCSQPTSVNLERIGYQHQETAISDGSTVTLLCDTPVIIQDPQSKYRSEDESVTMCCQTKPAIGVSYKWYKDGTELAGATNNELSLTSLVSDDQGLYQCSAKLTADPSLPAVMSREAMLTIRAASDDCSDALRPKVTEVFPGCFYDVGQCHKRPCRSSGSNEACSDDAVCCEVRGSVSPDCALGNLVTKVLSCTCSSRCPAPTTLIIKGTVYESNTDLPLTGIFVMLVGTTLNTTTDENGEFTMNLIPSSRRRLVAKASDSSGSFLYNYFVKTIPGTELFNEVFVKIPMVRKAPSIVINPVVENELTISSDPLTTNSGSTFLKIPANALHYTDGSLYKELVSMSLTFIDPKERIEDAPGEFITLNPDGVPETLATLGVFSIEFKDNSGNKLLLKNHIQVFAKGSTPALLWQLDEQTGAWVLIKDLPGRRKRQETQERLIGSINPQESSWYNIDYILQSPPCFFKIRVFLSNFSEENEVTKNVQISPKVIQTLSTDDGGGVRYMQPEGTGCFTILCTNNSRASISVIPWFSNVGTPLRAATVDDYNSGIKSILQRNQYRYERPDIDASKIVINAQVTESGPFYLNQSSCDAAAFDKPAFWFAELPEFSKSDFYDGSTERCVGKLRITIQSVMDPDAVNVAISSKINVISVWDNKYGSKTASTYLIDKWDLAPSMFHLYVGSCFEYKCSNTNTNTSVSIDFANFPVSYCEATTLYPPDLGSSGIQPGYFINKMSNVEEAITRCKIDDGDYAGNMNCSPNR